ncbi:cysteine desulfurase family protein [Tessaracoccus oleiagri]|uniref:cysteine desulfurase n=1 Tax=Tessaracoccus oleiagri TaxID=686624 RepID=A0A1G9M130_9ACTN|nr:cysteine desulfurase family protein [Tessaracoccus oleiagri]SDL67916.1 cysteine desulfurase [Tessaracoccus oleiagri]
MSEHGVYFDHAATSQLRPEAAEALRAALAVAGNPSALHRAGQRARARLEEAREELAAAIDADPSEVIFTSGGSEADSIAVLGGRRARGGRLLVSAVEHPAVLGARDRGAELIPVTDAGLVDVDAAAEMLQDDVAVVSVMWVNNETGIVQPVEELRRLAQASGAWFHTDAVQALGHVPLSFRGSGVDMLSLSAHKVGGPVGIGALVARREVRPAPVGLGGGQEREVRSGTGMVALAASFAAAATVATGELATESARLGAFGDRIAEALRALGATVNSHAAPHAPHIVNATFPGTRADDLLFLLDQRGVYASVGSACRAGVHQPSEVLLAMGRSEAEASSTLRFSMGWTTTAGDVERLLAVLEETVPLAQSAFR